MEDYITTFTAVIGLVPVLVGLAGTTKKQLKKWRKKRKKRALKTASQKGTKSLTVVSRSSERLRYRCVVVMLACPNSLLIWVIGTPDS